MLIWSTVYGGRCEVGQSESQRRQGRHLTYIRAHTARSTRHAGTRQEHELWQCQLTHADGVAMSRRDLFQLSRPRTPDPLARPQQISAAMWSHVTAQAKHINTQTAHVHGQCPCPCPCPCTDRPKNGRLVRVDPLQGARRGNGGEKGRHRH